MAATETRKVNIRHIFSTKCGGNINKTPIAAILRQINHWLHLMLICNLHGPDVKQLFLGEACFDRRIMFYGWFIFSEHSEEKSSGCHNDSLEKQIGRHHYHLKSFFANFITISPLRMEILLSNRNALELKLIMVAIFQTKLWCYVIKIMRKVKA